MEAYNKGKGEAFAWLRDHVNHPSEDCLWWPFSRRQTGYGAFGYLGKVHYAHRFMCELAHGPAPTPEHEAAHSCGNGMSACVNPRHLSWKTRSENQLDRRQHGTAVTCITGASGKISVDQRKEILALRGRMTQREIARKYGVHFETISRILRSDPNEILVSRSYQPHEDALLIERKVAGDRVPDIAVAVGRSIDSVEARLVRLRRNGKLQDTQTQEK